MAESLLMTGVTVTSGEYCAASAIAKILYDPNYASTYSKNEKEKKVYAWRNLYTTIPNITTIKIFSLT